MNSEVLQLLARRAEDVKAVGGPEAHRLHALQRLRIKTVVKESHCSPVHQLAFNHTDARLNNLFATVGKDQATVYDDMHMADYMDTVVHFTNAATEHAKGGDLSACAWVSAGNSEHPHGDALLAVGGADCAVSIISVVESRVVSLLQGHTKPIVELSGAAGAPGIVASLSSDGEVRVWQAEEERCLACVQTNGARCLAMSDDGRSFVTGGTRGALTLYALGGEGGATPVGEPLKLEGVDIKDSPVECMRFLPRNRLALRCANGQMVVADMDAKSAVSSWKLPGCNSLGASAATRCAFGNTPNGAFIAAGNHTGDVFVHDAASGKRLVVCKAVRVSAPVRAAGISADCRHVLSVLGNGYVFRYEYRMPSGKAGQEEDKENEDGNADGGEPMEEDEQ